VNANESGKGQPSVSRREALKKGAMIGGTVLWVAPLVQTIGMTGAYAQTTSGTGGNRGVNRGGAPEAESVGQSSGSGGTLALTGLNTEHAVELGLGAAAVGVALTAASLVKRHHGDEPGDDQGFDRLVADN
jgi:hypothetical protein